VTERDETPFWRYCRNMSIPDELKARLELFESVGQSAVRNTDLFKEVSWFSLMTGQGRPPRDYHPVADLISEDELKKRLEQVRSRVQTRVDGLMSHDAFIEKNCRANI
jgi:tryptophan halogenase